MQSLAEDLKKCCAGLMEDSSVQRAVWDSRIPVCFSMATDEVASIEEPKNIFMLLPRRSYFPLVTEKVFKYLATFVSPNTELTFWLDFNGIPLRWHYPIGLLYDLLNSDSRKPWGLTAHVKNYPHDELLSCPSLQIVEAHFIQMVKQADHIKHRSRVINVMQKHSQKQLWNALVTSRFDQFWEINRLLMVNTESEPIKQLPIILYRHKDYAFILRVWPVYRSDKSTELTLAGDLFALAEPRFENLSSEISSYGCFSDFLPTMSDMNAAKSNLRRSILSTLAKANPVDLKSQSGSVFKKLMMCPEYLRSKKVGVYLNTPLEVETGAILLHMFQEKMECYVPHFDKNSTYMDMIQMDSMEEVRNLPVVMWQIRQPIARTDGRMSLETGGLDLVIVPGVAFTKQGHRLGHGKGYYDRYLRRHFELFNRKPYTIGLAFREQIVDALPMSEFDVKLDLVIFA